MTGINDDARDSLKEPPPEYGETRPWGSFRRFVHDEPCTVKLMTVLPGCPSASSRWRASSACSASMPSRAACWRPVIRVSCSMSASESRCGTPSAAANSAPTVVLPLPISPTSTM